MKEQKITVALDTELARTLAAACQRHKCTKSAMVRYALREVLRGEI